LALPTKEARIEGFHTADDSLLTLHIQTHNSEHRLNLKKPESSVFSKNFKLHVLKKDDAGNTIFIDQTPSRRELFETERKIYIDSKSDAALHVHHVLNGEFRINGHFDGHSISHHENGQHFIRAIPGGQSGIIDYIDPHRKIAEPISNRNADAEEDPVIYVTPELGVVFDYNNYLTFEGNNTEMMNYVALFINGVNNRYSNIPNPKISFKITGLLVISSIEDQPFITASELPEGDGHDLSKMLHEYTTWVNNDAVDYFPVHDMAPMFTGVHLQSKDQSGNFVDGVAGLATVGDACFEGSTSIIYDSGANFAGINNLAHELAHSLGSYHDADTEAADCPQSDGYIMSYEGDGKKSNFYFSECSIAAIKKFITSPDGACLKSFEAPETWETPSGNPGDYISLNAQCRKALNNPTAFVDPSIPVDDICTNLVCVGEVEQGVASSYLGRMPADGSYCGESGSCFNGECVVEPDLDTQCKSATGKDNAYADADSADSQCKNLVCKYTEGDKINVTDTKKPAVNYSPCGRQGRCIDNTCVEPPQLSMTEQCAVGLFKPYAFVEPDKTPDELCGQLECRYIENGLEYGTTTYGPSADYTPCGMEGHCLNGKCIGENQNVPSFDDFVIY
jgi:hypothetical protein